MTSSDLQRSKLISEIAATLFESIQTGLRLVPFGPENNPFILRLLNAGEEFDENGIHDEAAEHRGLYLQTPSQGGWAWIASDIDLVSVTSLIESSLSEFTNRTLSQVLAAADITYDRRLERIRQIPKARNPLNAPDVILTNKQVSC